MGHGSTGRWACDSVPPIHGPMAGRQEAGGRDDDERAAGDVQPPDQTSEKAYVDQVTGDRGVPSTSSPGRRADPGGPRVAARPVAASRMRSGGPSEAARS